MTKQVELFDVVALAHDRPQDKLVRGQVGVVVEFVTLDADTLAVVSLHPDQVRAVEPREIAHARAVG